MGSFLILERVQLQIRDHEELVPTFFQPRGGGRTRGNQRQSQIQRLLCTSSGGQVGNLTFMVSPIQWGPQALTGTLHGCVQSCRESWHRTGSVIPFPPFPVPPKGRDGCGLSWVLIIQYSRWSTDHRSGCSSAPNIWQSHLVINTFLQKCHYWVENPNQHFQNCWLEISEMPLYED